MQHTEITLSSAPVLWRENPEYYCISTI